MTITVAAVDVETPGNIGTIARAMKNFGFTELVLVNPPSLDPDGEAYGYAGQARTDVLPNHTTVTFDELTANYHTIGFTAITNQTDANHVRYPFYTPRQLADTLSDSRAQVALVFGRESTGLTNDELAQIDEICSIPAAPNYPVLNLGQAATIALYELRSLTLTDTQHPDAINHATPQDLEAFYDHAERFLHTIQYPDVKRDKTMRLIRRLISRAHPTDRELITLRGVLTRAGYTPDTD